MVAAVLVVVERRRRLVRSSLTNSTRSRTAVFSSGEVHSAVREGGDFEGDTLTDRKPVKFFFNAGVM